MLSASTFGRFDHIKFWLSKYPDWDLENQDETGEGTVLARAVTFGAGRHELVRYLIQSGAKVDSVSKRRGMTVLMFACANEDADTRLLSILLQAVNRQHTYVNIHSRSRSMKQHVSDMIHRRSGESDEIRLAHFPVQNMTMITAAMGFSQDPQIVSALLDFGFSTDQSDFPFPSLNLASLLGNIKNVKFWLSYFPHADREERDKVFRQTPLLNALSQNNFARQPKMLKVLLDAGASIDATSDHDADVINNWLACSDSNPETFRILLDALKSRGMWNPSRRRGFGRAFKWKVLNGYFMTSYFFMRKRWLIGHATLPGSTYLFTAISNADVELVEILLDAGVDPKIRCSLGYDALKFCDHIGPYPSIRRLLERKVEDNRVSTGSSSS